jgi:hypothetical protein
VAVDEETHAAVVDEEHHEDVADSVTVVDVVDPVADSAAEAEVVSQEAAVAAAFREVVAVVVVVASVDADEEVTKSAFELFAMYLLERYRMIDTSSSLRDHFECHDDYQPIPRSSFDGVLELK